MANDEALAIAFIDGGSTRGTFTACLANLILESRNEGPISNLIRASGSIIIGNRLATVRTFLSKTNADWLLFIDSDIVFQPEDVVRLWNHRSEKQQVISGVYFLITEATSSIPIVTPCVFKYATEDAKDATPIHPLPENQVIEIDRAGFGFLLVSRLVLEKVMEESVNPFVGELIEDGTFIGEDFAFFDYLRKLQITSYCDTGIILGHEKTITLNEKYYKLVWHLTKEHPYLLQ